MLVVVAGRGDFTADVVVADLFKIFSFNGDVADVERRAGLSGDFAANDEVVVVVLLVPFVTFDFTVKDVGFAGTLKRFILKKFLMIFEWIFTVLQQEPMKLSFQ